MSAIPSGCKCWMLWPSDSPPGSPPGREVCQEFVPHEFLSLDGHPMCATCAHLKPCHLVPLIILP